MYFQHLLIISLLCIKIKIINKAPHLIYGLVIRHAAARFAQASTWRFIVEKSAVISDEKSYPYMRHRFDLHDLCVTGTAPGVALVAGAALHAVDDTSHHESVREKSHGVWVMIFKSFKCHDTGFLAGSLCIYVRPLLEYNASI
jgi:hypothetical protein